MYFYTFVFFLFLCPIMTVFLRSFAYLFFDDVFSALFFDKKLTFLN